MLARYDAGNRLVQQALDEVLEQQLDRSRRQAALAAAQTDHLRLFDTPRFTSLAFPLWAERVSSQLSTEDAVTRIQRMAAELEAPPRRRSASRASGR